MDINISGRKMNVGEALTEHAQDRLDTISDKYFARSIDAQTTFTKDGPFFRVDISMHPNQGINLQSHADADDPYAAFDTAADKVEKQLRRYKRRLKNHHHATTSDVSVQLGRQSVLAPEPEDGATVNGDGGLHEEDQPIIIAEDETNIPTVSVRDAVMLMDFSHAEALMFKNIKSGIMEVVYRRSDGNIGWISPKE